MVRDGVLRVVVFKLKQRIRRCLLFFTLLGLTSDISNDARMHAPRGLVGAVRQHMLDASDVEKLRERQVAQYNIS